MQNFLQKIPYLIPQISVTIFGLVMTIVFGILMNNKDNIYTPNTPPELLLQRNLLPNNSN